MCRHAKTGNKNYFIKRPLHYPDRVTEKCASFEFCCIFIKRTSLLRSFRCLFEGTSAVATGELEMLGQLKRIKVN